MDRYGTGTAETTVTFGTYQLVENHGMMNSWSLNYFCLNVYYIDIYIIASWWLMMIYHIFSLAEVGDFKNSCPERQILSSASTDMVRIFSCIW